MVTENQNQDHHQSITTRRCLIVGNYCHDVLTRDGVVMAESLGGAVSFISAVLDGLSISSDYICKVGPDFAYSGKISHPPIVSQSSNTTLFHAHFSSEIRGRQDRVLYRVQSCQPISPSDLPDSRFNFGLAVGVAGEILPGTLAKMLDICDTVFVDIQALIRVFDPVNGSVNLVGLKESGFFHLLPRIGFLKASAEEAPFVDVEEARKRCCVVVTNGEDGCTVYRKDGEFQVAPFSTVQVDPTGAGDSFLGGFVAGLVQGLTVPDAALLGNFFGSLSVGHIGLPTFDSRLLQRVRDEVQKRKMGSYEELNFMKPLGHEQFHASLGAAKLKSTSPIQECQWELPRSPKAIEQDMEPQSNGHQRLLFSTVYEEPIKSVEKQP